MSINPVGNLSPSANSEAANKAQETNQLTTVTTKCNKKHSHDQSCPHTVTTRPAPKLGEKGYYVDKTV